VDIGHVCVGMHVFVGRVCGRVGMHVCAEVQECMWENICVTCACENAFSIGLPQAYVVMRVFPLLLTLARVPFPPSLQTV